MKVNFQQRFCFNPPPTPDGAKRSRPSSFSVDRPVKNSGKSPPDEHKIYVQYLDFKDQRTEQCHTEHLRNKILEKTDEASPLIRSCFFCCSLTIGLMCSILIFIIFDLTFLIKKSKFMIDADFTYRSVHFNLLEQI